MRAVVQRVNYSYVDVEGDTVGRIGKGYMVLLGAMEGDTETDADYIIKKVSGLRVFEDENDKMNLSVGDVGGSVLLVSQFTLAGDARHGNRPSFSGALELLQSEGFQQVVNGIDAEALDGILRIGCGKDDQWRDGQRLDEVHAVQVGHVDVAEDGIHRVLFQELSCLQCTLALGSQFQEGYFAYVGYYLLER